MPGRDNGAQSDNVGIKKEPDHFGNPAEVLAQVFSVEPQIGTQPVPDIITAKDKSATAHVITIALPRHEQVWTCRNQKAQ